MGLDKLGLDGLDLAIIALYLAGITLFGLRFRKRQRTLRDYFLADRNIPWWAIALSIVAAETSTLTIISIPGLAYDTNLAFLQVVLGYLAGRVIISFVLLPHYFRGDLYTAYELIERRFGRRLRSLTAGLFLVTRAAAEGVRVYAVSIVVAIAIGTDEVSSIAIITVLTLIYTFEGGLAAVIWTDVVQTVIYVSGTLVGLFTIVHLVPGGWLAIHSVADAAGKLRIFDFTPDFWKPYTFWAGLIGGAFLTTASHGTDQLIVQRLLAARNQRQSVTALLSSGVAVLFQFALFLMAREEMIVIALGNGDKQYEEMFARLQKQFPQKIAIKIAYDNAIAHKIEAGSDMFLMPSKYEPCGLNQIYSLKYGTVPVVRATGGLDDTIEPWDARTGRGTGFKFTDYNGEALLLTIKEALKAFRDQNSWQTLMRNGMDKDFSWNNSAKEYGRIYERVRQLRATHNATAVATV